MRNIAIALLLFVLSSCGLVSYRTNLPVGLLHGNTASYQLKNMTGYKLRVELVSDACRFSLFWPRSPRYAWLEFGESVTICFLDLSYYSYFQEAVVIEAWRDDKLVAALGRDDLVVVQSHYRRSGSWMITNGDFGLP